MEAIQEGFSAFISGFARLFFASLIVWMGGLIVLLFREMFSSGEFALRDYLNKVWKMFRLSFEIVAYGAVIVGPILVFRAEEDLKLNYIMMTVAAVILSVIYLYIRKQAGALSLDRFRIRKEKNHRENWR